MRVDTCRICGKKPLYPILNYGSLALADSFLKSKEDIDKEAKYPLRLCICRSCKHIQIDDIIEPSILFEDYPWETGISKSIIKFSQEFYEKIIECYGSKPAPRVLEIASNDGSILSVFKQNKCEILGVDPAKNIVALANQRGVRSIAAFFNLNTSRQILEQYGKWDICIARNVLAHVNDIHGLAEGIKTILKEDGFAVIEVPHLKTMFEELQYDQVFHEHIGYHSLDSIKKLFAKYDMHVFNVEQVWIHGGSIRVFLQHNTGRRRVTQNVQTVLGEEESIGLLDEPAWEKFAVRAQNHKKMLVDELNKIKTSGGKTVVYGASGKGQTLLQFCGIDTSLVECVVDKSTMKQGKLTPGTHIQIFPPSRIYEVMPQVILLCAWNFASEIVEQEKQFSEQGGKFLHPFPSPHYIN